MAEMERKERPADEFSEVCVKIYSRILSIGVLIVLALFPLYYRDYYYDILEAKYVFYYMVMLGLFGVVALATLVFLVIDRVEYQFYYTKTFLSGFSWKEIKNHVLVTDWFLLAFLLVGVISTLQSDYVYESFWGNEGRFTGLFLHLIYGISFLLVSHLYRFKKWHMNVFLAAAMLPLLFGITDFFDLDILRFKEEIEGSDRFSFTSTFGNINTYATYVGMVFGCLGVLLVKEKSFWKGALYTAAFAITSMALIMCNSDNALLAVGLVFALLPLTAFQNRRGVTGYLLALAVFFSSAQAVAWLNQAKGSTGVRLEGACRLLVSLPGLWAAALICWAVVVALWALDLRRGKAALEKNKDRGEYGRKFVAAWGIFLILCVCAGLFVIYDANWGGNSSRYGSLAYYLKFSDAWGTHRGLAWRITMEAYREQPLLHKIWGYGLDTFGLLTIGYRAETNAICGQVFDSAHNEYLQYLVTIGPIGLAAYAGFLITAIRRILKKSEDKMWGMAIALGVGCYLLQATVTINLPIATPIMWMLLSVGVAGCAKKAKIR